MRAHRLFAGLFAAGIALRVVTQLAYRPALLYEDSIWYLENAASLVPMDRKPAGYSAFLNLLPIDATLAVVPLAHHLMGLATAVVVYALLLRLGVVRWAAALATAPLLLDAFQLLIEQMILSEALFELLLAGVCAVMLWRQPLTWRAAVAAGLLIALASLTRVIALVMIVPVLLALLATRPRWVTVAALLAGFAVPLTGYAAWYDSRNGSFALAGQDGRFLYARVAPFVECDEFEVPIAERPLCPLLPVSERPTPQEFAWFPKSPWFRLDGNPDQDALGASFAKRAIREQPLAYAEAVADSVLQGFAFVRDTPGRRVPFLQTWAFQAEYPKPRRFGPVIAAHGGTSGYVQPELSGFLRGYQKVAFTPGPLAALGLLVGLAAAVLANGSPLRRPAFLLSSLAAALVLAPALTHHLSPRYVLPTLVLLPPALAVGLTALRGSRTAIANDRSV